MLHQPPILHPPRRESSSRARRLAASLLADEAAADDVVRDVWVRSLRQRPSDFQDPHAWLTALTRHLGKSNGPSLLAGKHHVLTPDEPLVSPELLRGVTAAGVRESLRGAVEALAEPERSVVRLHHLEELTLDQVAVRMGCTRDTVRPVLRKAVDLLRLRLDAEYGSRRSWTVGLVFAFDWGREELRDSGVAITTGGTTDDARVLGGAKGLALVALLLALIVVATSWFAEPVRGEPRAFEEPVEQPVEVWDRAGSVGLTLRLVDRAGAPHAGVRVGLFGPDGFRFHGSTDARGILRAAHAPAGAIRVEVLDPARRVALAMFQETVVAGAEVQTVAFDVPEDLRAGTATGSLIDGDGGVPSGGRLFVVRDGSHGAAAVAIDPATGAVRVEGLPAGPMRLFYQHPERGVAQVASFVATPDSDVPLGSMALATGTLELETDRPRSALELGCTVLGLSPEPCEVALGALPAGTTRLDLFAGRYWLAERPAEGPPLVRSTWVYPGAISRLRMTRDATAHLGVVATLPGGTAPGERARLTVTPESGGPPQVAGLVAGRASVPLDLGEYRVTVESDGQRAVRTILLGAEDVERAREIQLWLE